jgi:PTS system mannose-specific IIC component
LPVHYQQKLVNEGKLQQACAVPIWGNGVKFLFRFIPTFICLYWGQTAVQAFATNSPQWLIDIMTIFGNPMSLIGFAILMKLLVSNWTDLIFFTVGFALVGALGCDMITVLFFALLVALLEFKIGRAKKAAQTAVALEEGDDF